MAQVLLFSRPKIGGAECERDRQDRLIFRLRAYAGLSMERTAEALNCSLEEVEQSLTRMLGLPPKKPEP
jgi:hypothetical protein